MLRILIVDDSATMRLMIRRAAERAGVPLEAVHEAGNGEHALSVLEHHPIDAVLTDINMPVMNGVELLRELSRRPEWRNVVRVIISTDGSRARQEEARALGVRVYLRKPVGPEAIRDAFTQIETARAESR
jgi:two-component system, chemotaxis family, chemotaxis protein CheY